VWGRGYVLRDAPEPLGAATAVVPGDNHTTRHDTAVA
jgi:hypothetical protein